MKACVVGYGAMGKIISEMLGDDLFLNVALECENKNFDNVEHYFSSEYLLDFLCESEYCEGYFLFSCGFKKGQPFFEFRAEFIECSSEYNAVLTGNKLDEFCRTIIDKCGE